MATVSDAIAQFQAEWGYVPTRFNSMDPNMPVADSYLDWIANNKPTSAPTTTTSTSTSTSGTSSTSSGTKLSDPSQITRIFYEYGLDPYTHFNGEPRAGGAESLVGKYTEQELRNILEGAPQDSPARIDSGSRTDITQDPTPDTDWTVEDVELVFAQYGLDPAVNFDGTTREGGAEGLAERLNSGDLSAFQLHTTLANYVGVLPGEQSYGGGDLSPGPGAAGEEGAPGVWAGGRLVRVQRQGADDKWAMVYDYNGKRVAWEFDSEEQMLATLGSMDAVGGYTNLSESNYNNNVIFAGSAAEITGPGSFNAWIRETLNNVALESGVADPTLWGRYMNDPDVSDILFQAAIEEWSEQQVMAKIRATDFYKNELFPGIESFYHMSDDPEREWYQYMANVRPILESLGVDPGSDGYRSVVGDMLNSGVSDETFVNMSGIFMRAATSQEYASALDEWFQIELGTSLDFDTYYDVLAGNAEAEVRDVVNKAVLEYQSQQQGAGLTNEQIARIAERRPAITDSDAAAFLNQFMESMTAVRDVSSRYGLSSDELLSAAAGIETPTGRSIEEVQRLARQAAGEAGRLDDEKVKFFLDFTAMGTPRRPGLSGLAPESG